MNKKDDKSREASTQELLVSTVLRAHYGGVNLRSKNETCVLDMLRNSRLGVSDGQYDFRDK